MNILTVSQLNLYVKSILDGDKNLSSIFIQGEISNLADNYKSGHIYFSLKDNKAVVKCVMFSFNSSKLKFAPKNGMNVFLRGKVSLYEATGQYQFYVEDMQPDGIGSLSLAFEQLKEKLQKEGLFDLKFKKQIPKFPKKIGVVTSENGAVFHDIVKTVDKRYKIAEIILYPASVQGQTAHKEIISGIKYLDENKLCDVIIVGRGGGSAEDLFCFNDETLARTIFEAKTPIISAVGHETDFTICDFVADLRAATPTMAAQMATPDSKELKKNIDDNLYIIKNLIDRKLESAKNNLDIINRKLNEKSPKNIIEIQAQSIDLIGEKMSKLIQIKTEKEKREFLILLNKLDLLSPVKILEKGYAVAYKDEMKINSVKDVSVDDIVNVKLQDGTLRCKAYEILEN